MVLRNYETHEECLQHEKNTVKTNKNSGRSSINIENKKIKRNIKSIISIFKESWEDMYNIKTSTYHAVWKE